MYLKWQTKKISTFSQDYVDLLYGEGYLFGRTGKGEMYQTRSLRIDLKRFKLSSENKRILNKTAELQLKTAPIPYSDYHWSIHKMGKDFYATKFGDKTFSANKIKELATDADKSNFNTILVYSLGCFDKKTLAIGYCVSLVTNNLVHYCYPFYDLKKSTKNMGLGMMTKAIIWAKEQGKIYIYLGSVSRPTDTYKLQFTGLEWFNGNEWTTNLSFLKKTLTQ